MTYPFLFEEESVIPALPEIPLFDEEDLEWIDNVEVLESELMESEPYPGTQQELEERIGQCYMGAHQYILREARSAFQPGERKKGEFIFEIGWQGNEAEKDQKLSLRLIGRHLFEQIEARISDQVSLKKTAIDVLEAQNVLMPGGVVFLRLAKSIAVSLSKERKTTSLAY